ncbi:hypothetical protein H4R33_005273 [Dimargaris cristalligena]|nr:hypothetical protein H4R33_005273 [Dimargaris cristalligena]
MSSAPVSTMNPTPRKALAAKNHNYAFLKNRSNPTDKMVSPCTKKLEARHYAKPGILQPKSLTNMLVQAAQKPKAVVVSTPTNNTAAALDAK